MTTENNGQAGTMYARLAREHCIERKGVWGQSRPHALESMAWTCMIRHTPQVAQALGAPVILARTGIGVTCQRCGGDFTARQSNARFCKPCRRQRDIEALREKWEAEKAANRRPPRPCDACQTSFIPYNGQQRFCGGCRTARKTG